MRIEPKFPADRRGVAEYAGVEQTYDQLAASAAPGQAIYYPQSGPAQPDFLIALEGVAYIFLKVTTDPHTVEGNRLMVNPGNGQPAVSSPLGATSVQIGGGQQTGVQGTGPEHLRDPGAGPAAPDGGACGPELG